MADRARILILEDEVLIGLALAEDLEERGFDVAGPFSSTAAAERWMEDARPDAALLDINLGRGRTSLDFARKLRGLGIPYAFLTGYSALPRTRPEIVSVPVLPKPVILPQAIDTLRKLTTGKSRRAASA